MSNINSIEKKREKRENKGKIESREQRIKLEKEMQENFMEDQVLMKENFCGLGRGRRK